MDSKTLRGALLIVTLFVLAMFLIVLGVNGVFDKPGKSIVSQTNSSSDNPENAADETGYIYGSDLSAWMYDDTFWDAEPIGGGKYQLEEDEETELERANGEDTSRKYKDRRFEDYNSGNL